MTPSVLVNALNAILIHLTFLSALVGHYRLPLDYFISGLRTAVDVSSRGKHDGKSGNCRNDISVVESMPVSGVV